jgi:uncharacterized cupredoxin-like copper-binding protein
VDDIMKGAAMITWRCAVMGLVPLALLSGACGGNDDDASSEIDASLEEFVFSPTGWTVAAGEEVTIELENNGSVVHEFVILQPGVEITSEAELPATEEELSADFVYWETGWIKPGQSKTDTFTAPEAGSYQVICAIATHFNAGMAATLSVEAP